MANFKFDGIDTLSADLEDLSQFTDEERLSLLRPAANLLIEGYRDKVQSIFKQRSGSLASSFVGTELATATETHIYVSPKGKHPKENKGLRRRKKLSTGNAKSKNKSLGVRVRRDKDNDNVASKTRNKSSGLITNHYYSTNAEVAYILEYGSPRIRATHFMEETNDELADKIVASQQEAFDDLLKKKGF